jgi:hypothetical protein
LYHYIYTRRIRMNKSIGFRLSSLVLALAFLLAACAPAAVVPATPTEAIQVAPTKAPPTAPTVAEVPPTEAPIKANCCALSDANR